MKRFEYDKTLYFIDVPVTGVVSLIVFLIALVSIITNRIPALMFLVGIVAFYSFWNALVAKVTPKEIDVDGDTLTLRSFNRRDAYSLTQLKSFKIREFPSAGKMFLRMNGGGVLKGRYWLNTKNYNDGHELFRLLLDMEYEKHPESLKARARRVNTEYNARAKKKKEAS
ncbi:MULTISPECIES: hypothetical protein [Enterococcus]|uniref:Uncharacterized protein n=1 Tax=Enterococcus malodoratus ATCC 43197 TaxID=1158601 RepID=R2QKU9_9ENTE|nr:MULTISPECIES: hypothetical protein [Enterococcus]BBM19926.1 hypothetical protein G15_3607 [Enterococcus avium]EOH72270.1 hypothetical protein UAI_03854 [Enterococcus malodoratus ATCC 43197]EOT70405.1 hypothetical protein I585_01885 [Enterococcus malodoratus ATCC 43197]OJG64210.1 hypothetical protein RV07_GL000355 [Enterococcus malodoratus]SET24048.1 hypothetical protein SAMN04487821_108109 [Enterococcus malodoratus]